MKCRNCGIMIPNGTLCDKCYEESKNSENRNQDKNLLLKLSRKFLPVYAIIQSLEWIFLGLVVCIMSIMIKNLLFLICSIIVFGLLVGINLFIKKRIAVGTKLYFYETKVVYCFDFLFIHKRNELKYEQIKDIGYNQTKLQKKFNLGVLIVFSKKSGFIFRGIRINDIANIEDTFKKIAQLVGDKIK